MESITTVAWRNEKTNMKSRSHQNALQALRQLMVFSGIQSKNAFHPLGVYCAICSPWHFSLSVSEQN